MPQQVTIDFNVDDETGEANVRDGQKVTIGGMITAKTVKTTKHNQLMAFVTIEDMVGTVEVIVFPRDYEAGRAVLNEDGKVFVYGKVSLGDEPKGRLVCERLIPFDAGPKELWIQFPDKQSWFSAEQEFRGLIADSDGPDQVVIYLTAKNGRKKFLGLRDSVKADAALLGKLTAKYGEENVKVVEKGY